MAKPADIEKAIKEGNINSLLDNGSLTKKELAEYIYNIYSKVYRSREENEAARLYLPKKMEKKDFTAFFTAKALCSFFDNGNYFNSHEDMENYVAELYQNAAKLSATCGDSISQRLDFIDNVIEKTGTYFIDYNDDNDNQFIKICDVLEKYARLDIQRTAGKKYKNAVKAEDRQSADVLIAEAEKKLKSEPAPQLLSQDFTDRLIQALAAPGAGSTEKRQKEIKLFFSALEGNYLDYSLLSKPLMFAVGSYKLRSVLNKYDFNMEDVDFSRADNPSTRKMLQALEENYNDPGFRIGMILGCNAPGGTGLKYRKAENYMNQLIMQKTLDLPKNQHPLNNQLNISESDSDILAVQYQNNLKSIVNLATTLFLTHLGETVIKDGSTVSDRAYSGCVTELYAHGGRIKINLPGNLGETEGHSSVDTIKTIFPDYSVKTRYFATHKFKRAKFTADENNQPKLVKDSKEGKPFITNIRNNYFYNVAIGGLYNTLSDGALIENNGESGHVYMKLEPGNKDKGAIALVGIESCEGGKGTHLGHKHDYRALNTFQNAFLTDKRGIGLRYNGRTVNLGDYDPNDIRNIVAEFRKRYQELLISRNTKKIQKVNALLSGKHLGKDNALSLASFIGVKMSETISAEQSPIDERDAPAITLDAADTGTDQMVDSSWLVLRDALYSAKAGFKNHLGLHTDSGEMTAIKRALDKYIINYPSQFENENIKMMQDIKTACYGYMHSEHHKSKSNARWKAVTKLFNFTDGELTRLGVQTDVAEAGVLTQ